MRRFFSPGSPERRGAVSAAAAAGLACLLLAASACQQDPNNPAPPGKDNVPAGPPLFKDVTRGSGVAVSYRNGEEAGFYAILESLGGGVALIDYDGDGLLDIFVPGGGHFEMTEAEYKKRREKDPKFEPRILGYPCKLYKNLGNFKFKDVTAEVFPAQPGFYTHGCAVADYDRDGWPDLLVTGYGRVALYRNAPDGKGGRRFIDVTKEAGLQEGILGKHFWATSAGFADLDGDGWPDLYVCQYANWSWKNNPDCPGYTADFPRDVCPPKQFIAMPHALYHNRKGCFHDVTRAAGIRIDHPLQEHGKGLGVVLVDVSGDGKPDIYVANDTVDNFLYLNRSTPGKLKFDEVGMGMGVARDDRGTPNGSMGTDAGDPFGSGLAALWCTNYEGELHALYRNMSRNGGQNFVYATQSAGIGAIGTLYVGFGTAFVDVDGDGWEDLVIANGHVIRHPKQSKLAQNPVLLLNEGAGRFRDATPRGGPYFHKGHRGRGLAVGDLDNDGRPDLVFSNVNEPAAVLGNVAGDDKGPKNQWLGVVLAGKARRDLVGTKLTLEVGGKKLTRFVKGGGSYLSALDPRLLFGLGGAAKVDRLTVDWSHGGGRQTWEGAALAVGRYWRLAEGERAPQPWPAAPPKARAP
jgi:enediyne biosynthesis protein E4